jgi:hypothetical protein
MTTMGDNLFERVTVAGSILIGSALALLIIVLSVGHYISLLVG